MISRHSFLTRNSTWGNVSPRQCLLFRNLRQPVKLIKVSNQEPAQRTQEVPENEQAGGIQGTADKRNLRFRDLEPVPIIHSNVFLMERFKKSEGPVSRPDTTDPHPKGQDGKSEDGDKSSPSVTRRSRSVQRTSSSSDGAVEWALSKVDKSLDDLEDNPTPFQRALYDLSRGPIGEATSSAVQAAARLTVDTTKSAAKAAAPVGKWALSEGSKTAMSLIQAALVEQAARAKRKQQEGRQQSGKEGEGRSKQ